MKEKQRQEQKRYKEKDEKVGIIIEICIFNR